MVSDVKCLRHIGARGKWGWGIVLLVGGQSQELWCGGFCGCGGCGGCGGCVAPTTGVHVHLHTRSFLSNTHTHMFVCLLACPSHTPCSATTVVACIPAYVTPDGAAVCVGSAHGTDPRRAAMGASGHLDADAINLEELEEADRAARELEEMEAPEGALV